MVQSLKYNVKCPGLSLSQFSICPLYLKSIPVHCLILTVLLLVSCAAPSKEIRRPQAGEYTEVGIASWYGIPYHGRKTANGEIYNMEELTAAHRTLPFNTIVSVLNLENNREVNLRINDRGPFVEGRIIDLSRAGARNIGMLGRGLARVSISVLRWGKATGYLTIQVGAFSIYENAVSLKERLSINFKDIRIIPYESPQGRLYRVRAGRTNSEEASKTLQKEIHNVIGLTTFIVREDN